MSKSCTALVGVEGYGKGKSALKETKAGLGRVLLSREKEGGDDGGDGKAAGAERR